MADVPDVVAIKLPGDEVTVYWVIAAPPSDAGAVHETPASALPPVADTPVGAPGKVSVGVILTKEIFGHTSVWGAYPLPFPVEPRRSPAAT